MRRDLDRIRELLLEMEASEDGVFRLRDQDFNEYDRYQIKRMAEAQLVRIKDRDHFKSKISVLPGGAIFIVETVEMTWAGHDYLDAVRDEGIWNKTKHAVTETGGSAALELVKKIATAYLKKKIEEQTGLHL